MFYISRPREADIAEFLTDAESDAYSYPEVGSSLSSPPKGYNIDHNRILLGRGDEAMMRAKDAIHSWKMFDMSWVELCWPTTPIVVGENVAILISHFGFYSLNAARIVYVIDEPNIFGFAYGTLTHHGEIGEERFTVEHDLSTGEVWYDLYAFSRPNHLMAKLGYPLTRYLQRCFARDSKAAMLAACAKS